MGTMNRILQVYIEPMTPQAGITSWRFRPRAFLFDVRAAGHIYICALTPFMLA